MACQRSWRHGARCRRSFPTSSSRFENSPRRVRRWRSAARSAARLAWQLGCAEARRMSASATTAMRQKATRLLSPLPRPAAGTRQIRPPNRARHGDLSMRGATGWTWTVARLQQQEPVGVRPHSARLRGGGARRRAHREQRAQPRHPAPAPLRRLRRRVQRPPPQTWRRQTTNALCQRTGAHSQSARVTLYRPLRVPAWRARFHAPVHAHRPHW